ncbi:MAG: hypothetical protein LIP09_05765 [Bacteroidales bacterium]|nr:hypothetical protein [Bacteroidales bacterium]
MALFRFKTKQYESQPKKYTEAQLVEGVSKKDRNCEKALYDYCRAYYDEKFRGVFFDGEERKEDIFQDAFITLWRKIERSLIYCQNNQIVNEKGQPFTSSLRTYFMAIARYKNLEISRESQDVDFMENPEDALKQAERKVNTLEEDAIECLYGGAETAQLEILADLVSKMSGRCKEILTLFYYNEKSLDEILIEIPSITTKNALKSKKNKCIENLKKTAQEMYDYYYN